MTESSQSARRRRVQTSDSLATPQRSSLVSNLATSALVAYGTYKVGEWAWEAYHRWNDEDSYLGGTSMDGSWFSAATAPTSNHREGKNTLFPARENWKRRRERMTICQSRVNETLQGFLPTIREIIYAKTEFQQATRELKKLRRVAATPRDEIESCHPNGVPPTSSQESLEEQQADLWDHIKVQSVTRMLTTAYAHTLVYLVLTVQVHLLGGRLFHGVHESDQQESDRHSNYQDSHRLVLSHTFDYFLQRGLPSLVGTVERAAQDVLADYNVLDASSMEISKATWNKLLSQLQSMIQDCRPSRTGTASGGRLGPRRSKPRSLLRFIMPPSSVQLDADVDEDPVALEILEECWDLLESPVLVDAQRECLETTFHFMREEHWGKLFCAANKDGDAKETATTRPLATILTQLKHTSQSFFAEPESGGDESSIISTSSYLPHLASLPAVVELGDVSFG